MLVRIDSGIEVAAEHVVAVVRDSGMHGWHETTQVYLTGGQCIKVDARWRNVVDQLKRALDQADNGAHARTAPPSENRPESRPATRPDNRA